MNKHLRDLILIALSTSILVVQELVLSFLPNIQLTTLLLLVYTKIYGLKKSIVIVFIYVLIDNLLFGSIMMMHIVIPMLLAWLVIVSSFSLLLKMTRHQIVYIVFAYLCGHVYGLMFVPFQAFILNIDPIAYMLVDIPWEIVMGISNALAVLWLFDPLTRSLTNLLQHMSLD